MIRHLRQWTIRGGMLLASAGWIGIAIVSAQDTPKSSVVTTTSSTSNYFLEYAIVLVMFGAALFAVCRTSRRNV